MRFVIALILLCVNFCFSCRQQTETVSLELAQIDSIMWDHPDSALALLEKVPKPSPSDKLNDATWCLLYTQAWDKNYKKHTSDSLINVALRYFDKQGDGHRKAQAWFYKGSVLKDLGELEEATECYVWARDLIGSFDEPLFASLICQTLGRVYREQKVYDLAFEQFREAIYYVTQVPRRDDWSHAYSELGRTFAERKRLDSARYYFERSLENAELINDLKAQAMAIGELGVVYFNEGDYKRALEYQKEELALKSQSGDSINFSSATFGIAVILYRMGELDSAEVYFKESLNTSNIERIQTTNLALYFISRRKHNHEEAFKYIDQYRFFTDSINSVNRTQAIAEAQEKYDNEKLENEKKTLLLEKERLRKLILRGWIVMIFFIGLLAFGYQRKLWLKERRLRKSEEHIHEYLSKVHENEEIIQTNKILMKSILEDFDDKIRLIDDLRNNIQILQSEKKEYQDNIEINIKNLQKETERLESENREYQCEIDRYSQSTVKNEARAIELEKQSNQNLFLKEWVTLLINYINNHVDLFKMLRENPRQTIDWTLLFESLDMVHNAFYSRLKKEFPFLNETDLQVCGLIKIGLTTSQISDIICISSSSVTKKKYRIPQAYQSMQRRNYRF